MVGDGGFAQGRSTNRSPLFCVYNFTHWRCLMKMFIIDQDMELWDIIRSGPKTPTKINGDGSIVPKDESEYTQNDLENVSKNFRAMNILYLPPRVFCLLFHCRTISFNWYQSLTHFLI